MIPQQHRPRSRDRSDQRRPTFQILNAVQPRTHTHGMRDYSHYGEPDPLTHPRSGQYYDRSIKVGSPSPHLQKRIIGVHTIGNKSCESVASSYRGPACNFTNNFRPNHSNSNNVSNDRYRHQSASPAVERPSKTSRSRSQSPQDRIVMDEPSDLVVWNASKKASRSNILCPLTDSEFRNINLKDTKTIMRAIPRASRSNSSPSHYHQQHHHQMIFPEPKNSILFNVENICREAAELLDDCVPPQMSPSQVSPSTSMASASTTYSLQISLVTQQLEEIQQAQNDVLKHLGEEISKVTGENERLQQEVDHVRDQNEGLLKVVRDTTEELERMKHIFRTRGLSHMETNIPNRHGDRDELVPEHSSALPPQSSQQQQSQRQYHQHSNKQPQLSPGGKRDSVNSSSSNKKSSMGDGDPAIAHLLSDIHESGESSYLKEAVEGSGNKSPKTKKNQQINQQRVETSADDQDVTVAAEDNNDDNVSYRSNDSQNAKHSSRRKAEHQHRRGHHHSHPSTNHNHEHHRRSRSRSKEKQIKSPRTSNCYEQDEKKTRPVVNKPVYQDDCNDNIEMKQSDGGGGCFRVFTCCWSSSSSRSRTDSVDDMILRGCPE